MGSLIEAIAEEKAEKALEDKAGGKAGGKARLSVEDGFTGPCVDLLVARNVDGGLPMHR